MKFEESQTLKNLCTSYTAETHEEGFADIAQLYKMIADIEGDHASLVKQLADQLRHDKLYMTIARSAWKCSECGFEATDTVAPKKCPVCQMPQGTYYLKTDLARYFKR